MAKHQRPLPTLWEVPDDLWERIEPLLRRLEPAAVTGRPRADRRRVLDAITPHLRWVQVSFDCVRVVNGIISHECMEMTVRSTAVFKIGVRRVSSRNSGHAWSKSAMS